MKSAAILCCLALLSAPFFVEAAVVRRSTGTFVINSTKTSHPEPNLAGLWTFDGPDISETTVNDKSGSGLSGTLNSFTAYQTALVPGKKAQALVFDGVDDNVSLGDVAESAAITLVAWVKPATAKTGMKIVSKKMSGASSQYGLATSNSDADKFTASFFSSAPSSDVCESTGTGGSYGANKWYFVAATYDLDTCKIYVNGVDVTTVSQDLANGSILNTTSALRIGADGGASIAAGSYFAGNIDDVRIYSRALTADEIRRLYGITSGGYAANTSKNDKITSGLVGLWSFDGPDMFTNVADRSGQGNHGSMISFVATSTATRPGKVGQGLRLDGINDSIITVYAATLGDFTACTWFNAEGNTNVAGARLIDKTYQTGFWIGSNTTGAANSWGGGVIEATPPYGRYVTLQNRGWNHICSRRSGTTHTIIGNGGSVTASGTVSGSALSSSVFRMGSEAVSPVSYYRGMLDDVRIYNRALSDKEILQLYNIGR